MFSMNTHGWQCLAWIVTSTAKTGNEQVDLEVRASNEAALRLYRRAGFRAIGRRRGYYADPIEDAVLLRLDLAK